jgi:PAS domain S-box-containing protein
MKKDDKEGWNPTPTTPRELRRRAERLFKSHTKKRTAERPEDYETLIHELQVHQIELELQNQELQQAHLEAEVARLKYFSLYDLAPVGYATFGRQGEILEINLTGVRLLGEERKRLISRRFQLFLSTTDIPIFNQFIEKIFATGSRQICEVTLLKNGDRLAAVRLEGVSAEPDEGGGSRCQAVLLDITEQRQSEQNLLESQARFQTLVDTIPDITFETDGEGDITFISKQWTVYTGMTSEETVNRGWVKALYPEEAQAEEARWMEVLQSGKFAEGRHRLRAADGSYRWFLVRARPSVNREGKIDRWTGAMTDVDELEMRVQERTTDLNKAYEQLSDQSRILESFFKDTLTPLVLLDRDFNFVRVNEAYARTCQRPAAAFPGHNHFELYPHEENEAIFRRVVETGIPYQALANPFSFPDHPEWGVTYWDWILTPLPDDRGATAFLVFSLEEVTDRQAAEEALRHSEGQLRSLAAQLIYAQESERKRIARDMHDSLGASLSALKYKLEALIHDLPEKEPQQIGETLGHLIPIFQETISEARRMQNELRPSLLDDLGILPTLRWLSREFQENYSWITVEQRVEVREEEVPELLKVVIFRITQEALNNTAKHARATQASIYLGWGQNRLNFAVQDNGIGFDTKRLPESANQSSGMGLSSMKERAELSGGFFAIKSSPGQGTTIEVSWPLVADGMEQEVE